MSKKKLVVRNFTAVMFEQRLREARKELSDLKAQLKDSVIVPRELTAENGAKTALMGEFKELRIMTCTACGGTGGDIDSNVDCEECGGAGDVNYYFTVDWDTIKKIHRKIVNHFTSKESKTNEL